MSNNQTSDNLIQEDSMQSVTGGSLPYASAYPNVTIASKGPTHSVCGTKLSFREVLGVYYCPKCKKEVSFNEVVK